eukprot:330860_1
MAASYSRHKRRGSVIVYEDEKSKPTKGFNINIFKSKQNALQYQCVICKQICKNPVELSCADDYDYDSTESNDNKSYNHDVLYCEACLSFNLSTNNNQCPINPKHLKTNYNIARNIRKQINNLSIYCSNNQTSNVEGDIRDNKGCKWEGKLHQLHTHLKTCKYNTKIHCDICNTICSENTINEHNAYNMVKHITLLHKHSLEKHEKKDNLLDINNNPVQINDEFATKIEEQIQALTSTNNKLKQEIKTIKHHFNEWKIAYNIEKNKTDIKLKKLLNTQDDSITILQQENQKLKHCTESQGKSIQELRTQIEQLKKIKPKKSKSKSPTTNIVKQSKKKKSKTILTLRRAKSKSVETCNVNVALLIKNNSKKKKRKKSAGSEEIKNNTSPDSAPDTDTPDTDPDFELPPNQPKLSNFTKSVPAFHAKLRKMPPVLKRTASMRYFHPEGTEWYHPQELIYEMYHPKKSVEVWVTKNMGQMSKLQRFPCCGSAKEGPLYLMANGNDKISDEELFIVGEDDDMPDDWSDKMHLGCKENRKKNKQNKSYYECCKKGIRNKGCKQRYKCCFEEKHEHDKDSGCKVGWGC